MMSTQPLVIAQIVPRLNEGGVERGVLDIVRLHHRWQVAQHNIISEGGRLAVDIENAGGRMHTLSTASKNPLSAPFRAWNLRQLLRQLKPDIVHVRSRVPAWLHYFANRTLHIPTVSTAHGINSINSYSRIMTRAAAVICPSLAVAAHLRAAYGDAGNLTVIPRGVDIEYFNPTSINHEVVTQRREQWQLAGRRVLLLVGRLSEQKGHEILLRALLKLPPTDVALFVGGDDVSGKRQQRLQMLAQQLGVSQRVVFAGNCSDMREIYALADVSLSCATKPESFGRMIAESLAMATPIIAAKHGGAIDMLTADEIGARGVPPRDSDALAAALIKPLPDASSSRARIVEKFTAERMAKETLAVYHSVLDEHNKGSKNS